MREGRRSLSFNSSLEIGVGEAKGWNTKFLRKDFRASVSLSKLQSADKALEICVHVAILRRQ